MVGDDMFELTAETTIFVLRLALLAFLYLFIVLVGTGIRRSIGAGAGVVPAQYHRAVQSSTPTQLVVLDPGQTSLEPGGSFPLRPITHLGRSSTSTIVLDDTFVSGEHAVIAYRDGGWWLADRGSTNGTILNDTPVRGETELVAGDVIVLGQIRLRVAA